MTALPHKLDRKAAWIVLQKPMFLQIMAFQEEGSQACSKMHLILANVAQV